jgi:NifB/MoaA-like Fe-S oxidoreductase
MLRSNEQVFLDDVTVDELSETLQVPITVVKSSGQDLLNALLDIKEK